MLSYIMENNESKRRQIYEECRESLGIGVSKLPEKPEVACRDEKIKGDFFLFAGKLFRFFPLGRQAARPFQGAPPQN